MSKTDSVRNLVPRGRLKSPIGPLRTYFVDVMNFEEEQEEYDDHLCIYKGDRESNIVRVKMLTNETEEAVDDPYGILSINVNELKVELRQRFLRVGGNKKDLQDNFFDGQLIKATIINREKVNGRFYIYFNIECDDGEIRNIDGGILAPGMKES